MAAYALGRLEMWSPARQQDYGTKTTALVAKPVGKYLVRGGTMERLEGTGQLPSAFVVLEFPSMAQA
jgi:uncharacterized protein (DUF1330 family)